MLSAASCARVRRAASSTTAFWIALFVPLALFVGAAAAVFATGAAAGAALLGVASAVAALAVGFLLVLRLFGCAFLRAEGSHRGMIQSATPLHVDLLATEYGGVVGMSSSPGRKRGSECRDLATDVARLKEHYGLDAVVSLLEPGELRRMEISTLGDEVRSRGMEWFYFAQNRDKWVPTDVERYLSTAVRPLAALVAAKKRVLVHCNGGKGRTGLLVACALHSSRRDPQARVWAHVRAMRACRSGMLTNPLQQLFLLWLCAHGRLPSEASRARARVVHDDDGAPATLPPCARDPTREERTEPHEALPEP